MYYKPPCPDSTLYMLSLYKVFPKFQPYIVSQTFIRPRIKSEKAIYINNSEKMT